MPGATSTPPHRAAYLITVLRSTLRAEESSAGVRGEPYISVNLCKDGDICSATKLMYKLFDKGYSVMDILDNFFLFVKTTTLLTEVEKYKIIPSICKYITIFHDVHEDEIELALFTNNLISIFSLSTI